MPRAGVPALRAKLLVALEREAIPSGDPFPVAPDRAAAFYRRSTPMIAELERGAEAYRDALASPRECFEVRRARVAGSTSPTRSSPIAASAAAMREALPARGSAVALTVAPDRQIDRQSMGVKVLRGRGGEVSTPPSIIEVWPVTKRAASGAEVADRTGASSAFARPQAAGQASHVALERVVASPA